MKKKFESCNQAFSNNYTTPPPNPSVKVAYLTNRNSHVTLSHFLIDGSEGEKLKEGWKRFMKECKNPEHGINLKCAITPENERQRVDSEGKRLWVSWKALDSFILCYKTHHIQAHQGILFPGILWRTLIPSHFVHTDYPRQDNFSLESMFV